MYFEHFIFVFTFFVSIITWTFKLKFLYWHWWLHEPLTFMESFHGTSYRRSTVTQQPFWYISLVYISIDENTSQKFYIAYNICPIWLWAFGCPLMRIPLNANELLLSTRCQSTLFWQSRNNKTRKSAKICNQNYSNQTMMEGMTSSTASGCTVSGYIF